jgi:hypothetical protein
MLVVDAVEALQKAGYKVAEIDPEFPGFAVQTKQEEHVMTVVSDRGHVSQKTIEHLVERAH